MEASSPARPVAMSTRLRKKRGLLRRSKYASSARCALRRQCRCSLIKPHYSSAASKSLQTARHSLHAANPARGMHIQLRRVLEPELLFDARAVRLDGTLAEVQ